MTADVASHLYFTDSMSWRERCLLQFRQPLYDTTSENRRWWAVRFSQGVLYIRLPPRASLLCTYADRYSRWQYTCNLFKICHKEDKRQETFQVIFVYVPCRQSSQSWSCGRFSFLLTPKTSLTPDFLRGWNGPLLSTYESFWRDRRCWEMPFYSSTFHCHGWPQSPKACQAWAQFTICSWVHLKRSSGAWFLCTWAQYQWGLEATIHGQAWTVSKTTVPKQSILWL